MAVARVTVYSLLFGVCIIETAILLSCVADALRAAKADVPALAAKEADS